MTKKKEYYHITYLDTRNDFQDTIYLRQEVIDIEPQEWLMKCFKEFTHEEMYYLLYSKKISKEMYLKMKG